MSDNLQSTMLQKQVKPASVSSQLQDQQQKATVSFLRRLWYSLKGFTLEDARRLKEIGMLMAEGKAGEQLAKARKVDGEAAKLHAEAESIRQEQALKDLQLQRERLNMKQNQLDILERRAAAMERLVSAVQTLKIKGGEVLVDGEQIENALKRIGLPPNVEEDEEDEL